MEQAVKTEQGMSSFNKKIGQSTFRVNVYFAENTTATFEDKLLHLMENDIAKRKVSTSDAEEETHTNHYFYG